MVRRYGSCLIRSDEETNADQRARCEVYHTITEVISVFLCFFQFLSALLGLIKALTAFPAKICQNSLLVGVAQMLPVSLSTIHRHHHPVSVQNMLYAQSATNFTLPWKQQWK